MSVTAIIVTHNSADVIASALKPFGTAKKVGRIIVVDNASTDETVELVSEKFPAVEIIRNETNQGFGRACNQALEKVETDFALLLNPDGVINAKGIDALLASAQKNPDAAIFAPFLEGNEFDPSSASVREPVIPSRIQIQGSMRFISGAIALWRMAHMKKIGFFDPAFFLFYEDDDISLRTLRGGYKLLLVPEAKASHVPGKSCRMDEALSRLKLRSSAWSYFYIHKKYRGALAAKLLAYTEQRKTKKVLRSLPVAMDPIEAARNAEKILWEKTSQAEQKLWAEMYATEKDLLQEMEAAEKALWEETHIAEKALWEETHIMEKALWDKTHIAEKELWKNLDRANEKWRQSAQGEENKLWNESRLLEEKQIAGHESAMAVEDREKFWLEVQQRKEKIWLAMQQKKEALLKKMLGEKDQLWHEIPKERDALWHETNMRKTELWSAARQKKEELWSVAQKNKEELWAAAQKNKEELWTDAQQKKEALWADALRQKEDGWQHSEARRESEERHRAAIQFLNNPNRFEP